MLSLIPLSHGSPAPQARTACGLLPRGIFHYLLDFLASAAILLPLVQRALQGWDLRASHAVAPVGPFPFPPACGPCVGRRALLSCSGLLLFLRAWAGLSGHLPWLAPGQVQQVSFAAVSQVLVLSLQQDDADPGQGLWPTEILSGLKLF